MWIHSTQFSIKMFKHAFVSQYIVPRMAQAVKLHTVKVER